MTSTDSISEHTILNNCADETSAEKKAEAFRAGIKEAFHSKGWLLLRKFSPNIDDFVSFSNTLGDNFSNYRSGFFSDRKTFNGNETVMTATGDTQEFAIPLHGEMYYRSVRPRILWFYCQISPGKDGQTTLCDGEALYKNLSVETKEFFEKMPVRYRTRYTQSEWQENFPAATLSEIENYCRDMNYDLKVNHDDGSIKIDYVSSALSGNGRDKPFCFINNVVALFMGEASFKKGVLHAGIPRTASNDFPVKVRMKDGSKIPRKIISEILTESKKLTIEHTWQKGDILLIDNTRIMHGRNSSYSSERKIFVRICDGLR
ncbi:MAG: TauD/TfdA family dioxygenase [Pyrinomonadaceae bacterium]|nr:TauD/TfdA family dioxygenase [Pyrinomonadaceae bacterium]